MSKPKPHAACYIGATNGDRAKDDFYPTPAGATLALLQVEHFPGVIWEPACGDGAIGKIFEANGYGVLGTDLVYRGYGYGELDFFGYIEPPNPNCRSLITNPPYKIKTPTGNIMVEDWIKHAWAMPQIEKMALFMKTTALAGKERSRVLENSNFSKLYQFRQRVTLHPNGIAPVDGNTGMMDFAWYIFDRDHPAAPRIYWIDEVKETKESKQMEMFK